MKTQSANLGNRGRLKLVFLLMTAVLMLSACGSKKGGAPIAPPPPPPPGSPVITCAGCPGSQVVFGTGIGRSRVGMSDQVRFELALTVVGDASMQATTPYGFGYGYAQGSVFGHGVLHVAQDTYPVSCPMPPGVYNVTPVGVGVWQNDGFDRIPLQAQGPATLTFELSAWMNSALPASNGLLISGSFPYYLEWHDNFILTSINGQSLVHNQCVFSVGQ